MSQLVEERQCPVVEVVQFVFCEPTLPSAVCDRIAQALAFEESVAEVDERIPIAAVVARIGEWWLFLLGGITRAVLR